MIENSIININPSSAEPVYKQIVKSVELAIEGNLLLLNSILPSVNEIAEGFNVSRDTVFKAYNELRLAGVIDSIPGKGYYVVNTKLQQKQNVFLMFNELTSYKEELFNSFKDTLGDNYNVDLYFHHYNETTYRSLLNANQNYYHHYVLMPLYSNVYKNIISNLPQKNIVLLDVAFGIYPEYSGAFQDFRGSLASIFSQNKKLFNKYLKVNIVIPSNYVIPDIQIGFEEACKLNNISYSIINNIDISLIKKNEAWILLNDEQLIKMVTISKQLSLKIGNDIGIVSYNENPLKTVIANGITTISTDFYAMGKTAAEMLQNKIKKQILIPTKLIKRKSL